MRELGIRVQFVQNRAVEVILFVAVVRIRIFTLVISVELVPVHAAPDFLSDFFDLALVIRVADKSQGFNEFFFWVVEIGQLNREIELVDQFISF